MIVVDRYSGGGLRAVLSANREWLVLLRARERNAVLRRCALRALYDWRNKKLVRLFTIAVNSAPYNYGHPSNTPLVHTGKMRNLVLNQGRGEARAKTDATGTQQVSAQLRAYFGHPVDAEIARVTKIIPPQDVEYYIERFQTHLKAEFSGLQVVPTGVAVSTGTVDDKGKSSYRLRLSVSARRRLGVRSNRSRPRK
jgi:hypothetical protein